MPVTVTVYTAAGDVEDVVWLDDVTDKLKSGLPALAGRPMPLRCTVCTKGGVLTALSAILAEPAIEPVCTGVKLNGRVQELPGARDSVADERFSSGLVLDLL